MRTHLNEGTWLPPSWARLVLALGVAVGGALAVTPLATRVGRLPSVFYLLVVLVSAMVGRLLAGLVAVVVSAGLLDYYATPPLHSLVPDTTLDWFALAAFSVVGLIVSWVITNERVSRAYATAMAESNRRLYEQEVRARRESENAKEYLSLMSRLSETLAPPMDDPVTFTRLGELVVQSLANLCLIDVLDDDGAIVRVAAVHREPSKQRLANRLLEEFGPSPGGEHPVARVISGGPAEFAGEMTEEFLRRTTRNEEHLRVVLELGFQSFVCVPLKTRGKILGTLTLVSTEPGRRYSEEDLATAWEIGRRAAVSLENARLYGQRDHIARTLQQVLLPSSLPEVPGLDWAAVYRPRAEGMEVGGDFYDAFRRPDGTVGIVIGDVCGKGPEAAAVMGVARQTVRVAGMSESRPSSILRTLNRALIQADFGHRFVTVCDVRLRPHEGGATLTVCCAGHPLPMHLTTSGQVDAVGAPGTLLGVFPDVDLVDVTVQLGDGDALVMFTDGLIEPGPSVPEREHQFRMLLAGLAGRPAAEVAAAVESWWGPTGGTRPRDDAALVVIRAAPLTVRPD
jgi:serine phosphatase RsbU (regulator of sigma subunit)